MMNGRKLQDRLYLGLGLSARHVGQSADAFRPKGPLNPLDNQNRFLRLPATFVSAKGNEGRTNVYGEVLWHGIFDASYTRAGDFIVLGNQIYFVASQVPLLPVLCVKTNRVISIVRPNMQTSTAGNTYGGYTSGSSMMLMNEWPASVLGENRSSASVTDLPTDQAIPYWNILLPALAHIVLSPGDLVTDDLHRTAVVVGSELTDLGWRISAKMATT
jgi:hypothetical protein